MAATRLDHTVTALGPHGDARATAVFALDPQHSQRRVDDFREAIARQLCHVDFEFQGAREARALTWSLHRAGPVIVNGLHASPSTFSRRGAELRDGDASYCLLICRMGSLEVSSRAGTVSVAQGRALLLRNDEWAAVRAWNTASSWSLRVERSALEAMTRAADLHVGREPLRPSASLPLLASYLEGFAQASGEASPSLACAAGQHIVDLLALALDARSDARGLCEARGLMAARREAVLGEIARRFADPDLSAAGVARRLGLSERYLRNLLEGDGSFTAVVLEHRLQRARQLLARHHPRVLTVSEIALRVGFSDFSYFTRAFRRRFGETPTEWRARSHPKAAPPLLDRY